MKKIIPLALLLTVWATSGAQAAQGSDAINWKKGVITVIGEGAPSLKEENPAKRRLMAKRAAMVDGYRKLAEAIAGVHVTSQTTVKNFETEEDEVRSEVSGLIKGAQILEENVTSDGGYEVRLEVPLYGESSLAATIFESSLLPYRKNAPVSSSNQAASQPSPETEEGEKEVSGVIVDARQLGAQPAMAPTLVDEQGQEIYMASLPIQADDLVAQGAAGFVRSLDEAKQLPRVGAHPIVVRAKRVKGPFHADFVLGAEAAKQLRDAEQAHQVLQNLSVVIVY